MILLSTRQVVCFLNYWLFINLLIGQW